MRGSDDAGKATRIQVRITNTEVVPQEVAGSLEQKNMHFSAERKNSMPARYVYGVIFLIPNLCAWIVRDYGQMVQRHPHYLKSCGINGRDCIHTLGVLRVSLGCFVSFF
ncbi:Serine incorporator/TMS membrane protein [Parasponia andersonii]|uniref:Serine incorporator/TMS membrane protein n=1 Tax=Parasponia andersonii TaxID=3476 RepID=A0A2P5AHU0_PARAD|nr:Serine incorporator/TMS membrane protein [Parasponia andersonii]